MERDKSNLGKLVNNRAVRVATAAVATTVAAERVAVRAGYSPFAGTKNIADELVVKDAHKAYDQIVDILPDVEEAEAQTPSCPTVMPSSMCNWAINTSLPAVGQFVSGPDAVPSGSGSLRLFSNGDGNSVVEVNTKNHKDVLLSDISTLEYYTYGQLGTVTYPKLILNVSTNYGVDSLTFIPAFQSQVPEPGVWQSWNAKNGTWRSRFPGFATDYPAQTFSDYVAFAPNATIVNAEDGSGGLLFKASSSDSADVFDVSVDKFTIGFSSVDTTWDFEPDVVVPTATPENTSTNTPTNTATPTETLVLPTNTSTFTSTITPTPNRIVAVGGRAERINPDDLEPLPVGTGSNSARNRIAKGVATVAGSLVSIVGLAALRKRRTS